MGVLASKAFLGENKVYYGLDARQRESASLEDITGCEVQKTTGSIVLHVSNQSHAYVAINSKENRNILSNLLTVEV